jgi:hypothetical protein
MGTDNPIPIYKCGVKIVHLYQCEGCGANYSDSLAANKCAARGIEQTPLRPGDFVMNASGSLGHYSGDPYENPWLIVVKPNDGRFSGGGAMKTLPAYYNMIWVVTAIETTDHRSRIHLLSMGGPQSTRRTVQGYTYSSGHMTPDRIEHPPRELVDWWAANWYWWTGAMASGLT